MDADRKFGSQGSQPQHGRICPAAGLIDVGGGLSLGGIGAGRAFWRRSGWEVTPPCLRFEARSAREFIAYAGTLLRRNPTTLSGLITLPALAAFCAGLFQALPAYLAALIAAGHLIAATLRSAGIAQQKTLAENRLEMGRSAPSAIARRPTPFSVSNHFPDEAQPLAVASLDQYPN